MILTSEEHLKTDIQPEIIDQAKGNEDIMRKVWAMEVYYPKNASETYFIAFSLLGKKVKHMS